MSVDERGGHPRSTAKIGGHPIHPMLIPFPIVCFIGTLVTDVMFAADRQSTAGRRRRASLLGVGLVMAALAAVAGLTDFIGDDRIRRLERRAQAHARQRHRGRARDGQLRASPATTTTHPQSPASTCPAWCVLLLLYSGWKGGDLVFATVSA